MDNKLISLLIKVGMGLLLLVGLILISNNLSYNSTGDEPLVNQEFFVETYMLPTEDGQKPVEKSIVHYDYVLDYDNNLVVDMSNGDMYELSTFVESKGKTKDIKMLDDNSSIADGAVMEDLVDPILVNEYGLQSATGKSITYTKWLMYGGLFLILVFTVVNIVKEPKRFIRLAIGIVLLTIITTICFYSVDTEGIGKVTQLDSYSDASYQISAAGIAMFIVLTIIAGAMIAVGIVSGALRYFSK